MSNDAGEPHPWLFHRLGGNVITANQISTPPTSEPAGVFLMRFVGWREDGTLRKGSPGNYENGEIHALRYNNCLFPWWTLLEDQSPENRNKAAMAADKRKRDRARRGR